MGTIFLNFFSVTSEVAECAAALSPNSLLTLHALETVAQRLESGIAFTHVMDSGRNINLGVTHTIPVDKFMQTSLATKVCGVHMSFFVLMLTRARAPRLLIIQ